MLSPVRARDVRVGETYVVEVPHHLPRSRYPMQHDDVGGLIQWWQLQSLRGGYFRLTVTGIDTTTASPMVDGIRLLARSHVRVDLTLEQALQLGLPPGRYWVEGLLRDGSDDLVELPDLATVRVPIRWLHPGDFQREPPTHVDLDQRRW